MEIESRQGRGTRVRVRLPLTLAIIDGFLVGVGRASYMVPLEMVVECMELSAEDAARVAAVEAIDELEMEEESAEAEEEVSS